MTAVGKYGASWEVEWGFYGTFNGNAEGECKKERKGQIIVILNHGRIENPAKSRRLFSQKSFIVDIWQGSEYAPNSEYNKVTSRSYYSLSTLLFKLITPWLHGNQNFMEIINLWQGCDYALGSEYVRVLNILGYIIYVTASGIFKTLDYLEHFLFWHIKVYLRIFNHSSDIFRHICDSV